MPNKFLDDHKNMSKLDTRVTQINLNSNIEHLARFTSAETVNSWGIISDKFDHCKVSDNLSDDDDLNRDCKKRCDACHIENRCEKRCNNRCEKRCDKKGTNYWVANNGSNLLAKYGHDGNLITSVIVTAGAPTGLVLNNSRSFGGFELLTATENGTVDAFNPMSGNATTSVITTPNAVYKGIEIVSNQLYVCNFNSGFVEIYNKNFSLISTFTDQALVNAGYAPFNIKSHKNKLYVTFAMQNAAKHDDVKGDGFGYVDIFSISGGFCQRLINREPLNAPWGLAFDDHREFLYVGNFGDGRINIFDLECGVFIKPVTDKNFNTLVLDGLWGILSIKEGLAFASGIDAEANGLIGVLCFNNLK